MNDFKEIDLINAFINNIKAPLIRKAKNSPLFEYFTHKNVYSNNPYPNEYKDIKKELEFFKSVYRDDIRYYTESFYCYLAAVFRCIHNDGNIITKNQLEFVKVRKDRFTGPNEAIDYFVTVYLPYRDDLYKYNNLDNMWHNEHTYLRIGHNVVLTYNGGFSNINEQEVYDFIGDYMDYGVSGLTYYLIGFYYNNHNKYNLSIDMLKYALDNYESFVDYMLLNNLDYRRLSEEKVLEYFQNSFNKTIIK